MKYEYYIASRMRNKETVLLLTKKLREKAKNVYCFIESDPFNTMQRNPEETMKEFEETSDWWHNPITRNIFEKDIVPLRVSKTLLLLLPAGKSAHIEAGIAYGMGKKLVLIGEQKEAESLYLIFDKWYKTIDDFIESI